MIVKSLMLMIERSEKYYDNEWQHREVIMEALQEQLCISKKKKITETLIKRTHAH